MRCITLADALTKLGATCQFICREHFGNLISYIQSKGYNVYSLSMCSDVDKDLNHSAWLGSTQAQDAEACTTVLNELQVDWLVVDHYALDTRWEEQLKRHCRNLMVIDDLADRRHTCDALLDQTFGREETDYRYLVPDKCKVFCGAQYSLLRPEFSKLRPYSLHRRKKSELKRLLVSMGGVDKENVTAQVLDYLRCSALPSDCEITVVMGATAPWLANIQLQAETMPWPTFVFAGVDHMAQLMAESDLAIGAAGATSWERCCLGLPTIMVVTAENQFKIAHELYHAGAVFLLNKKKLQKGNGIAKKILQSENLLRVSQIASTITDGLGCSRITAVLVDEGQHAN